MQLEDITRWQAALLLVGALAVIGAAVALTGGGQDAMDSGAMTGDTDAMDHDGSGAMEGDGAMESDGAMTNGSTDGGAMDGGSMER